MIHSDASDTTQEKSDKTGQVGGEGRPEPDWLLNRTVMSKWVDRINVTPDKHPEDSFVPRQEKVAMLLTLASYTWRVAAEKQADRKTDPDKQKGRR